MKQIVSAIYLRPKYVELNLKLVLINLKIIDIVSLTVSCNFERRNTIIFISLVWPVHVSELQLERVQDNGSQPDLDSGSRSGRIGSKSG